jgi:hypothetical protein
VQSLFYLKPPFRARRRIDDVAFLDGLIRHEASGSLSDTPALDAHLIDDVREKGGRIANMLLLLRYPQAYERVVGDVLSITRTGTPAYEPADKSTTQALQLSHSDGAPSGDGREFTVSLFVSRTLCLENSRLYLSQEFTNLVARALTLIEKRSEQALEVGPHRHRDGAWRVAVETSDKVVELLDALLEHCIVIRLIDLRHGDSFR